MTNGHKSSWLWSRSHLVFKQMLTKLLNESQASASEWLKLAFPKDCGWAMLNCLCMLARRQRLEFQLLGSKWEGTTCCSQTLAEALDRKQNKQERRAQRCALWTVWKPAKTWLSQSRLCHFWINHFGSDSLAINPVGIIRVCSSHGRMKLEYLECYPRCIWWTLPFIALVSADQGLRMGELHFTIPSFFYEGNNPILFRIGPAHACSELKMGL